MFNDRPEIQRGVVAVAVRSGRLLVIERSRKVVAPGAFCFPGGGVEVGESEEDALRRELREELGVDVRPITRLWQSITPWNVALAWWQVEVDADAAFHLNANEVASVHWFSVGQMRALDRLLRSNHDFLDALERGEIALDLRGGEVADAPDAG